ncbi:hypothetical protein HK101_000857 [Irineochytrium annulatum]|nr:hypothetical protein HK101_000857 [Irineochytrium annulatum]
MTLKDCEIAIYKYMHLLLTHTYDMNALSYCLLKLTYYSQYFAPEFQRLFFRAATRFGITDDANYTLSFTTTCNSNVSMMTVYMDRYIKYCEDRGDIMQATLCQYYKYGYAYLSGDLDYLDVIYGKFVQNPLLKENRVLAFTASSSNFRVAMMRGRDLHEIDEYKTAFEPHGQFIDAIKYACGMTELYYLWYQAYYGESATLLNKLEVLEHRIDILATGPVNTRDKAYRDTARQIFIDMNAPVYVRWVNF